MIILSVQSSKQRKHRLRLSKNSGEAAKEPPPADSPSCTLASPLEDWLFQRKAKSLRDRCFSFMKNSALQERCFGLQKQFLGTSVNKRLPEVASSLPLSPLTKFFTSSFFASCTLPACRRMGLRACGRDQRAFLSSFGILRSPYRMKRLHVRKSSFRFSSVHSFLRSCCMHRHGKKPCLIHGSNKLPRQIRRQWNRIISPRIAFQ